MHKSIGHIVPDFPLSYDGCDFLRRTISRRLTFAALPQPGGPTNRTAAGLGAFSGRAPFLATITAQEILPFNGKLITAACCSYTIYK